MAVVAMRGKAVRFEQYPLLRPNMELGIGHLFNIRVNGSSERCDSDHPARSKKYEGHSRQKAKDSAAGNPMVGQALPKLKVRDPVEMGYCVKCEV